VVAAAAMELMTIESELFGKLKNVFAFPFKVKTYEELHRDQFLEIFSFLLHLYDESWLVKTEQPSKAVKQIQG